MYRDTTGTQIVRAVGTWIFTASLLAMPMFVTSITSAQTSRSGAVGMGVVVLGAGLNVGARLRLAHLDRLSRPFLEGPGGRKVLKRRYAFAKQITVAKRILLAAFMVAGTVLILVITLYMCEDRVDGVCGLTAQPSDLTVTLWQVAGAVLGGLYIASVILGRTHESETDRMAMIISEGEQRRRGDDPFAGIQGRWD